MPVEDTTSTDVSASQEPYVSSADDTWAQEPLEELPPAHAGACSGRAGIRSSSRCWLCC